MVTGLVIPADPEQPLEQREFVRLEDYQAAVDGWLEAIDVHRLGITIYVNEEGLRRHLRFNRRASFLWWYHMPEARQKTKLVGTAVLVGLPDRSGDNTDLPSNLRHMLTGGVWRVEVRTHGDPKWYGNQMQYTDYFEALVWAMLTLERWTAAEDMRVVPVGPDSIARGAT